MLLWILLALLAILALVALAAVYLFRRSLPQTRGTLRVPGLRAPVEILRDEWGVPHIYAQNQDDLFFAQGFVHAQDRLWQMEMNRRLCAGRLSELFGEIAFETDRLIRTLGFARTAEQDEQMLDDDTRRVLEAYARGVNAFIADATRTKRLPPEFLLLGLKPAAWRVRDSVVWAKYMGWGLSANWDMELARAAFIGKLGVERAAQLESEYPRDNPTILPSGSWAFADTVLEQFRAAQTLPAIGLRGGSNNWVVDGSKTLTGKPLLANDPHLPILVPGIWYENHLVAPDFEATGVSFPGGAGIVIGHNREIAWGFTNAFPDVQDLYVEKPNPADPRTFEFRGAWERATIVREEIRVKGRAEPHIEEVVITRHGPILNSVLPLAANTPPLALRWTGYEPSRVYRAIYRLDRAHNWNEFTEALRDWTLPSQNMVYADRAGNIGYYQPGLIPIRARGFGLLPSPGWTGEYEWTGWIPHEELPHAFNPPQHFVASANNRVVGDDYRYFLAHDYANGYRAARITALLVEKEKLTPDDFARMHTDFYCAPAKDFLAHLHELTPRDESTARALDALKAWDCHLTPDSVAGGLYKTMEYFALRRIFADKLGDALADRFIGVGLHPLLAPLTLYYDRSLVTLNRLLEQEHSEWYADAATGAPRTRAEVLALALDDAIAALRKHYGDDMSRWAWGNLHRLGFNHTLGAQKPLDKIFNRAARPLGGDPSTVWQGAYVPAFPIEQVHFAPSWRQIIDLADWDNSRAVHVPGQSGHPASKHYDDMIEPWQRGEYHSLLWSRANVDKHAVARLVLE